MRARTQRTGIVAVVAAALTMGLTFAHTLELPQKLGYDAALWTRIQQSLYRWFGVVGGAVEVAAFAAAVVFALRTRGRPGGRLAIGGAALFAAATGGGGAEGTVTSRFPEPALPPERHGE